MFDFLNTMMERKPRYEHDCPDCTWLGPSGEYDLYACITGYGPHHLKIDTVIARYGTDGDYVSGLEFIDKHPGLGAAYVRAADYILQVRYKALSQDKAPCGHKVYSEETDHCAVMDCDNYIAKCILWPNHPALKKEEK